MSHSPDNPSDQQLPQAEQTDSGHRTTREVQHGPFDLDSIAQRQSAGWTIRSIEWVRPGASSRVLAGAEIPYGLRPVEGSLGKELEDDPAEIEVLMEALRGITRDVPLSQIAERLNERFSYQRNGRRWDQVALFELLPRLIEVGPDLLSSEQWAKFRDQRRDGELSRLAV